MKLNVKRLPVAINESSPTLIPGDRKTCGNSFFRVSEFMGIPLSGKNRIKNYSISVVRGEMGWF
jgi:hypothetical protein